MERLLRYGLSYRQARANCSRLGDQAYDAAIASGATENEAQAAYRAAFEREMAWYEGATYDHGQDRGGVA